MGNVLNFTKLKLIKKTIIPSIKYFDVQISCEKGVAGKGSLLLASVSKEFMAAFYNRTEERCSEIQAAVYAMMEGQQCKGHMIFSLDPEWGKSDMTISHAFSLLKNEAALLEKHEGPNIFGVYCCSSFALFAIHSEAGWHLDVGDSDIIMQWDFIGFEGYNEYIKKK